MQNYRVISIPSDFKSCPAKIIGTRMISFLDDIHGKRHSLTDLLKKYGSREFMINRIINPNMSKFTSISYTLEVNGKPYERQAERGRISDLNENDSFRISLRLELLYCSMIHFESSELFEGEKFFIPIPSEELRGFQCNIWLYYLSEYMRMIMFGYPPHACYTVANRRWHREEAGRFLRSALAAAVQDDGEDETKKLNQLLAALDSELLNVDNGRTGCLSRLYSYARSHLPWRKLPGANH